MQFIIVRTGAAGDTTLKGRAVICLFVKFGAHETNLVVREVPKLATKTIFKTAIMDGETTRIETNSEQIRPGSGFLSLLSRNLRTKTS